ncbi:hypothetical protein L1987_78962 [Smallanthus sonchifolius]|uniref:Uncharacterized protein n=1 Tax=Smallanthus sonchifolius TaxID=185202 RepID=A0ACB8ZEQ1_9ASTR|nr:hypothetical protein L1987_78962 [Smallanthus sonchifolius]
MTLCSMLQKMASEGGSTSVQSHETDDPAWEYFILEEDDTITCLFCNGVTEGGIYQAKLHLIGGNRKVKPCLLCPQDVKDKLKVNMIKQKSKKIVVDEDVKDKLKVNMIKQKSKKSVVDENEDVVVGKKRNGVHIGGQGKRMKSNGSGRVDMLTRSNGKSTRESSMNDVWTAIARFIYEADSSSNLVLAGKFLMIARGKISPADWWKLYGKEIPNVQELAVKVLSLTCSSSYCERNLSTYDDINFKKMNQLENKKAQDLAFVRHNLKLKNRHAKDVVYDPISLEEIDYSNEWLIGKMEEQILENENLTTVDVANANGAGDEEYEEDFDSYGEDMEDEFEAAYSNDLKNENLNFFGDGDDDGFY